MSSDIISLQDLDFMSAEQTEDSAERNEVIDYKMVTFSLGGKDYGIDIMKVKEISKASKFTYVPNSIPFVKGVYNLRGDIISVIDLRLMFNLPVPDNHGAPENMIILRLEDNTLGVIVDTIDKVVGISSEKIQPPHPLFGDINIKFIKGIVENDEKLYIILDVDRVFDQDSAETAIRENSMKPSAVPAAALKAPSGAKPAAAEGTDLSFIRETLATFKHFYTSPVNEQWISTRLKSWQESRKSAGLDIQLGSSTDADEFLSGFESRYSGMFWEKEYMDVLTGILPESEGGLYGCWNAGCGKGEESYSIAVALKKRFPSSKIKIHANDNDLLNISTAPNLIFARNAIPDVYEPYITEGRNGWHFISDIKDLILFEYHDVLSGNQNQPVDLIIARDVISFQTLDNQQKLIDIFYEKLKQGGVLIAGTNEKIFGDGWKPLGDNRIPAYIKS